MIDNNLFLPDGENREVSIKDDALLCLRKDGWCFLKQGKVIFEGADTIWSCEKVSTIRKATAYMLAEQRGLFALVCKDGRMLSDFTNSMGSSRSLAISLLGKKVNFEKWLTSDNSNDERRKRRMEEIKDLTITTEPMECSIVCYPTGTCRGAVKEGKLYLLQEDGSYVPPQEDKDFFFIMDMEASERRLQVRLDNGKWGIAELDTGKVVLQPVWDFVEEYAAGYTRVYEGCELRSCEDGWMVHPRGGTYFFVDKDGLRISETNYRNAAPFDSGTDEKLDQITTYIKTLTPAKTRNALLGLLYNGSQRQLDEFIRKHMVE